MVEVTFISGLNADLIAIDCGFDSDLDTLRDKAKRIADRVEVY